MTEIISPDEFEKKLLPEPGIIYQAWEGRRNYWPHGETNFKKNETIQAVFGRELRYDDLEPEDPFSGRLAPPVHIPLPRPVIPPEHQTKPAFEIKSESLRFCGGWRGHAAMQDAEWARGAFQGEVSLAHDDDGPKVVAPPSAFKIAGFAGTHWRWTPRLIAANVALPLVVENNLTIYLRKALAERLASFLG